MTQFFHYTDDQGAEKIIRSGRVLASLKTSGDAAFGNGVYMTKLKPESSTRSQVAKNNWLNISYDSLKKTKKVFVLEIPDNKVKNVSTKTRSIFMFGGRKGKDLRLVKYKWYLLDFDTGKILASHKYHFGSTGPNSSRITMGDYVMTEKTVNGRPVYKKRFLWYNHFLYMASYGEWLVGRNTDKDVAWLRQKGKYSLGPDTEAAWDYGGYGADGKLCWKGDDATLKAYPWHKDSQWKTGYHSESRVDPGSASTAVTLATDPATSSSSTAAPGVATATATTPARTTATTPARTTATTPARTTATTPARTTATTPARTTATTPARTTATTSASTTASSLTTAATTPVLPKSTATSSNMPDPASDNGLQSSGTSRSGRVDSGPPGKTKGLRRRLAAMFQ